MTNDPKKVLAPFKLPDYRAAKPTLYLEKNGNTVAAAQQLSSFKIGLCEIEFPTPNAITMFYNKSWKEFEKGITIYKKLIKPKLAETGQYKVPKRDLPKLYDYFEHIQTCVITIYSAVEALCNVAIPRDFTLEKKNQRKVTEVWNKTNIERWMSTEEKLSKIVPDILGIDSPKKLNIWSNFIKLQQTRDNIIHQKQSPAKPNEIKSEFLQTLLNENIFETIMSGFGIIQYLCEKDKMHSHFPVLDGEVPLKVNIVNRFDDVFTGPRPKPSRRKIK